MFIEGGYDKTTLRQIADQLGFTQAAIYYYFSAKEDILIALHLRMHELGRPALNQLGKETGPSGWAAVLRGLADTMLANRKLFVLHTRNPTAFSGLHRKGHDGDHEEIEQQFRQILGNPAIPARDRIRLSCALGALLSTLISLSALEDVDPPPTATSSARPSPTSSIHKAKDLQQPMASRYPMQAAAGRPA